MSVEENYIKQFTQQATESIKNSIGVSALLMKYLSPLKLHLFPLTNHHMRILQAKLSTYFAIDRLNMP